MKKELGDVRNTLLSLDLNESDELCASQASLDKRVFDYSLRIKKLLFASSHAHDSTTASPDGKGVKLPKLEVPRFDGNILNWKSFWEQFCVSVHNRPTLSDAKNWYTSNSL